VPGSVADAWKAVVTRVRRALSIRIRAKMGLIFAALSVFTCGLLTLVLFLSFRWLTRQVIDSRLLAVVSVAAANLDGDAHAAIHGPEDRDTPAYQEAYHYLANVRDAKGDAARNVYTMRAAADGSFTFVVDTDPGEPAGLGEEYPEADAWMRSHLFGLQEPAVEDGFYTDRWGTWLSGFAPIRRSDGGIDGYVGIDLPADWVVARQRRFLWTAAGVFAVAFPLVAGLGLWLGARITAPIVRLQEGASRIAEGDFSHRVQLRSTDELGRLAGLFNSMADRVEESYRALEQKVDERTADLAAAQALLTAAIEQSPAGIIVADAPDVRIRTANPVALAVFGLSQDNHGRTEDAYAARGRSLFRQDGTPFASDELPLARAVLHGETVRGIEMVLRNDDDERQSRWILANAAPVRDRNGQVIAGVAVFMDITERRRAEDKLRESERYVRDLLDALPAGIVIVDEESRAVRDVNTVIMGWLGLDKAALVGKPATFVRTPSTREGMPDDERTQPSGSSERELACADGHRAAVLETAVPVRLLGHPCVVQVYTDITEHKTAQELLRTLSTSDGLTGMPNRRAFEERLNAEWRRAARTGRSLSLLMADLDHFKPYNDHHGHLAGDECLKKVGAVMAGCFARASEMPSRWGGEEFTVIMADVGHDDAVAAAERFREAVVNARVERQRHPGVVTVSVGVATTRPMAGVAPEALVAAADAALYKAKQAGRNRVHADVMGAGV